MRRAPALAGLAVGGFPTWRWKWNCRPAWASAYALFSGLLFIGAASLVLTPFVHRIMHKLHIEVD